MAVREQARQTEPARPFDHPFYLIINLAIGGHLAKQNNDGGIDAEGYPKTLLVDWVRVYEQAGVDHAGQAGE